ncbi:Ran-binding-domain-containing protein [Neocallimastix californiae]|uniref:Ran-binding-domain-containing protein n=1 Tax=Neocallimastix californiae TaxID=1754190 RepID=A0A1Y2FCG6_9FUNG|nr:Ran-binding-domain-containing protein [Neocallimastix californiae]|eukprot:ORY80545.1 Ran-binding-domain-containing protein [Neocallimastix californiae]
MNGIEELLINLTCNSLSVVGKSAFSYAAKMAVNQIKDQIKNRTKNKSTLDTLKQKLEMKLSVITPTIDMFELIVARGNTALVSTMELIIPLKNKINSLYEEIGNKDKVSVLSEDHLIKSLNEIITMIDEITPILNLALLTSHTILQQSNQNYSKTIISPSKLMKATTEIYNCEKAFRESKNLKAQVGPSFSLKMYSLFTSSSRQRKQDVDWTWKEEFNLSRVFINRVGDKEKDYVYELEIVENIEDDRYHDENEIKSGKSIISDYPNEKFFIPGRKIIYNISNIRSLFYASSGSLLNIEECTSAVLVLKIEISTSNDSEDQPKEQWIAFEVDNFVPDDDDDDDDDTENKKIVKKESSRSGYSHLSSGENQWGILSHLEYLIRLTMMESYLQNSCSNASDEMVILFLQSSFSNTQPQRVIRNSSISSETSNLTNIKLISNK